MSVDIDVFPQMSKLPCWSELINQARDLARGTPAEPLLVGVVHARHHDTSTVIAAEAKLVVGEYYSFRLCVPNTLTVSCTSNLSAYIHDEFSYIAEFDDSSAERVRHLAERWRHVGHLFAVDSLGGRARGEIHLLFVLAVAIARLTDGVVGIPGNVGVISKGLYEADELIKRLPRNAGDFMA